MLFKAEKRYFTLDGKPFFFYSGEIQYFREKKSLWPKHLKKLKAAGCNAVTTYIPWSWHELEEGRFDFTGETLPERDLLGFLEMVQEAGLYAALKPGPYILAEFEDRGIPGWLSQDYPEIQAQSVDMITYMHPTFHKFVGLWYDAVLPIIRDKQITHGGPVIMLQVCNEVGLYNWLDGAGDTSEISLGYFARYLGKEYKTVEALNRTYGSSWANFDEVKAPGGITANTGEYLHWVDWHQFHRWYYAEYLSWAIREIKARGIEIQLYHNIPGWVFGRGQEYPVNISFYGEIVKRHPEMVFGVDHIPENPNYRNQHDDLIINEMTRALQGGQKPMWAAEQQAGSREHNVHTFPNELELFYKACIARGMTGMNLYMFSQGVNPHRRGAFGPTFYWMNALGHDTSEKPLYDVVKKVGDLIHTFGEAWMQTDRRSQAGVVFYRPYYHDEFFFPLFGGVPALDPAKAGLRYNPKAMRNTYYFEGMLKVLTIQNRDFDMVDIQRQAPDPKVHPQLWVMALDCMDEASQRRLADYVNHGGHLIIWPGLPDKDLKMNPCTILQEALAVRETGTIGHNFVSKIDLLGFEDINAYPMVRCFDPKDAEVIASLPGGEPCGLRKKCGQGTVTLIGTIIGYNIKEHLYVYEKLFRHTSPKRHLTLGNPALQAHVRYGKDYAMLGLFNYTPVRQSTSVTITGVADHGSITMPDQGELVLEPHQGVLIPLHYPLDEGRKILWSSCEILDFQLNEKNMEVTVAGNPCQETGIMLWSSYALSRAKMNERPLTVEKQPGNQWKVVIPAGFQERRITVFWE